MPEAWNNLATVCFNTERPKEGVLACERGIACNPSYPLLYNTLGHHYYKAGLYDRALENFLTSEKLLPTNASIAMNSALGFAAQGNEDEAMRQYNRAMDLGYGKSTAAFYQITVHLKQHRKNGGRQPQEF